MSVEEGSVVSGTVIGARRVTAVGKGELQGGESDQ